MARILVVEDETFIALTLQDDLQLEGYTVDVVGNGESALERARGNTYDLIVLDVMLPGKSGFEVCRELKRLGVGSSILILSAKSQVEEKVLGLELGADDYLTKPFDPFELRARIKALLRRRGDDAQRRIVFGDYQIDFDRQEVRSGNKTLDLTPLEFKLLSALVKHRGQVLTRDRLLNLAWGEGVYLSDRVVDTHIAKLRKKISPQPGNPPFILTVRGSGYRFDG